MKLSYFLNPGEIINSEIRSSFPLLGLAVSGVSFMFFFLLTGLDNQTGFLLPAIKGLLFGTIGIAFLAVIIWLIVKGLNNGNKLEHVIGSFSLCYTTTMLFTFLGLFLKIIIGWNTSVSLGMSGMLFTFSPMISVITSFTGGKRFLDVIIITFAGIYVILFWALLNKML
jgi:hypothetical protein